MKELLIMFGICFASVSIVYILIAIVDQIYWKMGDFKNYLRKRKFEKSHLKNFLSLKSEIPQGKSYVTAYAMGSSKPYDVEINRRGNIFDFDFLCFGFTSVTDTVEIYDINLPSKKENGEIKERFLSKRKEIIEITEEMQKQYG